MMPSCGSTICKGNLAEVEMCHTKACERQDCVWADWSDWGACDKCGGQKRRFRHIISLPSYGGRPCDSKDSEEIQSCDRLCNKAGYCTWAEWGEWTKCSLTACTPQTRQRRRSLVVSFMVGATSIAVVFGMCKHTRQ